MRVAVTGGIGEGKSTVLKMLSEMGHSTASADEMARSIFGRPNVNRRLAEIAGKPYPIAPSDLRHAIAKSPILRREVNAITHAEIMAAIRASDAEFIEVPLLVETCLYPQFDEVWVVTCGPEEQRRRLVERYGNAEAAEALIATQLATRVKIAFADRVIRTNEPLDSVPGVLSLAVSGLLK